MSRRAYFLAAAFALALVLLPFLFWYDTWFGRRLRDEQIQEYVSAAGKPRRAQHALVQIGERLSRGDASVRRWYPDVIRLSASPTPELRQTAAWIMGQDNTHEPFRAALHRLLDDPSAIVRRNAALSLATFRDAAARPELRAMLRPYRVEAPAAGEVQYRLGAGDYANPGTLLVRVAGREVRSAVPGEVRALLHRDGERVSPGDALLEISPDSTHAWEALRALYLVGDSADLEDVRRFARTGEEKLQRQAVLTARRIESRAR
jgi:hypothetical protein